MNLAAYQDLLLFDAKETFVLLWLLKSERERERDSVIHV